MKYTQEKGFIVHKKIELDLQKTGLTYTSTETTLFKKNPEISELFFSYAEISNQKSHVKTTPALIKSLYIRCAIAILIVYFVLLSSYGLLNTPENRTTLSLIYTPIVIAFALYHSVKRKMIVVHTHQGGQFPIIDDADSEKIYSDILANRYTYLREKYIEDTATKNILTQETLDWLFSLKVISHEELETIGAQNKKNSGTGNVGFNK